MRTLNRWAALCLVAVTMGGPAQAAKPKAKGSFLSGNTRTMPRHHTTTFTIAATGEMEPIEIGVTRGVLTELRLQYPLKVAGVRGSLWVYFENGVETVWVAPPPEEVLSGGKPVSATEGLAGEATITLKDGRTLEVTGTWSRFDFDQIVNIQLPPTCLSPPAPLSCEAERTQIGQLTEANASLAQVVEEMAQHPGLRQILVEHNGRNGAISDGLTGSAAAEPRGFMVPDRPFTWQKPPPCNAAADQEAINGGCWVSTGRTAPCHSETFEHAGKCFVPVAKRSQTPSQSEDPEKRDSQPAP